MKFTIFKPFVHSVNIQVPINMVGAGVVFVAGENSKTVEGLGLSHTIKCLRKHSEGRGVGGTRLQDWSVGHAAGQ